MNLIDFNLCDTNEKYYGGDAGNKLGIIYNNEEWFLKFPKSTRDMLRKVNVSYTTSPLSEYIGSQIYASMGIPVHQTLLGEKNGKIVVACKDFLKGHDRLIEFKNIKNSYLLSSSNEDISSEGQGTILSDVLKVIDNNSTLNYFGQEVYDRFWNMFVVDMLIANGDRNNGNWGVIFHEDGRKTLAPVYDNGNSFNTKSSEDSFKKLLETEQNLRHSAYKTRVCSYSYDNGKPINPADYILSCHNNECNYAVLRIHKLLDINKVYEIIDNIPIEYNGLNVIGASQKEYYKKSFNLRKEEILDAATAKINSLEADKLNGCKDKFN